jgi:outer membrane receptor protein involved in Fe transport
MTYSYDRYKLLWQAQYVGSMAFSNTYTLDTQNILRVGSYWLHNATALADLTDEVQVRVICNNIFNTQPPYGTVAGSTYSASGAIGTYDILGRYLEVGASVKF